MSKEPDPHIPSTILVMEESATPG